MTAKRTIRTCFYLAMPLLIASIAIAGCAANPTLAPAPSQRTATAVASRPTSTPTAPPTPTPPPVEKGGAVTAAALNLRAGPGTHHQVVGSLEKGDRVVLTGRSEKGDWLAVTTAGGQAGWVAAPYISTSANVADLPVAGGTTGPTPEARATGMAAATTGPLPTSGATGGAPTSPEGWSFRADMMIWLGFTAVECEMGKGFDQTIGASEEEIGALSRTAQEMAQVWVSGGDDALAELAGTKGVEYLWSNVFSYDDATARKPIGELTADCSYAVEREIFQGTDLTPVAEAHNVNLASVERETAGGYERMFLVVWEAVPPGGGAE